jgi:hypothetical protein
MSEFIKMRLSEARAKFEQIDELKEPTVRSYYNKAGEQGKKIADKMKMGGGDWTKDGSDTNTLRKRAAGRTMALKRRSGDVKMSEEAEQIDYDLFESIMLGEGDLTIRTLYNKYADHALGAGDAPQPKKAAAVKKAIIKVHGSEVMGHLEKAKNANARQDYDSEDEHFERARDAARKHKSETLGSSVGKGRSAFRKSLGEEAEDDGWYTHSQMHGSKKSEKHPKGISAAEWKSGIRWHHGQNKRINIKEEVEQIDEISKATALGVIKSSLNTNSPRSVSNLASKGGYELGKAGDDDYTAGEKEDAKSVKRSKSAVLAAKKLAGTAKVNAKEEVEGCMLDTSMGGADQIAQSKTGEIYKKSSKQTTGPSPATGTSTHIVAGKTGEAMNTTAITRRVPAVESAVLDVMAKTFEKRKMFEDASNIAIISPEQRQDWLEVSKGSMGVVDYFNKYKV